MKYFTYFTHIPKTAGSSFKASLLIPNHESYYQPSLKKFIWTSYNKKTCIGGHHAFGLHYFKPLRSYQYLSILRDPVQRAISHYHFVKESFNSGWAHPDAYLHQEQDIFDILEGDGKGKFREGLWANLQTRFIAGILVGFNNKIQDRTLLKVAKQNIDTSYAFIGIQERFEESIATIQEMLGWTSVPLKKRYQETKAKKIYSSKELVRLENLHQLDFEIYEYAQRKFLSS